MIQVSQEGIHYTHSKQTHMTGPIHLVRQTVKRPANDEHTIYTVKSELMAKSQHGDFHWEAISTFDEEQGSDITFISILRPTNTGAEALNLQLLKTAESIV